MIDVFDLIERNANLAIEVGYNSVADWCVTIYDKKECKLSGAPKCVSVQECDYRLALAKAYVELCDYLSETRGGY